MVRSFGRAHLVAIACFTLAVAAACGGGDDGGSSAGDDTPSSGGAGQSTCELGNCGACTGCFDLCLCTTGDVGACASACGSGTGGTGAVGAGGSGVGGAGVGGSGVGGVGGSGVGGSGVGGSGGGTGGTGFGGTGGTGVGGSGGDPGTGGVGGDPGFGGAGGDPGVGGAGGMGGNGQMPPMSPVYRIEFRVHRNLTSLSNQELFEILEEVNWIWWSQAAICFETHTVNDNQTMSTGYDMWFTSGTIACAPGSNGVYCGSDHDIWTVDHPSLGSVNDPMWDTMKNASRTAAHELGHGLNLNHYNGYFDSNDSLMSSGKQGFKLHDSEIQTARNRAKNKALSDTTPIYCNPPQVN